MEQSKIIDTLETYHCHPCTSSSSKENHSLAQNRVLTHLAAIFNLLARNPISKTVFGNCSSVCDSSVGPISFCSSALYIAKFCCCGDHVLELALVEKLLARNFVGGASFSTNAS